MADPKIDEEDRLGQRLAEAWNAQKLAAFYGLVVSELGPRVCRSLRRRFPDLSMEDCEDCFAQVLTRVFEKNSIRSNPQAYLWTAAMNEARSMLNERTLAREKNDGIHEEDVPHARVTEHIATMLIEGLVEDVDADATWASSVVEAAITRLRPALRRTMNHVVVHGLDEPADEAAATLSTTAATFRANKSNALSDLGELIPQVMAETGIRPPHARQVEVFAAKYAFAEDSGEGSDE